MRIFKLAPVLLAAFPFLVSAKDDCKGGQARCKGNVMQSCNTKAVPNKWEGNIICYNTQQCTVIDDGGGKQHCECYDLVTLTKARNVCVPEAHRCDEHNNIQECGDDGAWKTIKHCGKPTICHVNMSLKDSGECRPPVSSRQTSPDGCVPKAHRCNVHQKSQELQECTNRRAWKTVAQCANGEVCEVNETLPDGGQCRSALAPRGFFGIAALANGTENEDAIAKAWACDIFNERSCGPKNTIYECSHKEKKWVEILKCEQNTRCKMNLPEGECDPVPVIELCSLNATRCHDNAMQRCTEPNTWTNMDDSMQCQRGKICHEDCGKEACILNCLDPKGSNARLLQCTPGARQCDATLSRVVTCTKDRMWETEEMCPNAGDCKPGSPALCERPPLPSIKFAPPKSSSTLGYAPPKPSESGVISSPQPSTLLTSSVSTLSEPTTSSNTSVAQPPKLTTTVSSSVVPVSSSTSVSTTSTMDNAGAVPTPDISVPSSSVNTWTVSLTWAPTNPWETPIIKTKSSTTISGLSLMSMPMSSVSGTPMLSSSSQSATSTQSVPGTPGPPPPPPCVCPIVDPSKPGPPPPPCICSPVLTSLGLRHRAPVNAPPKPRMETCRIPGSDRCLHGKTETVQECVTVNEVSQWYDVLDCPHDTPCRADANPVTGSVIASCGRPLTPKTNSSLNEFCDRPGIDRCVSGIPDKIQVCITVNDVSSWYTVTTCPSNTICHVSIDESTSSKIASCDAPPSPKTHARQLDPPTYGPCTADEKGLEKCITGNRIDTLARVVKCTIGSADTFAYIETTPCAPPTTVCEESFGKAHCTRNITAPHDPPGCEKWDKICSWEHDKLLTCNVKTQKYEVELLCTEGGICVMDTPRRARCANGGVEPSPPDVDAPRVPGVCKTFDKRCEGDVVMACDVGTQTWRKEMMCWVGKGETESGCVVDGEFGAHCRNGGVLGAREYSR